MVPCSMAISLASLHSLSIEERAARQTGAFKTTKMQSSEKQSMIAAKRSLAMIIQMGLWSMSKQVPLFKQFACYQQALDLVCALVYLTGFGIAEDALKKVICLA